MSLYDRLADLTVRINEVDYSRRQRETTSEFTRVSTVISLQGDGQTGLGEDVTYETADHDTLLAADPTFDLVGSHTVDSLSSHLANRDLFDGRTPDQEVFRNYRQWGFESAALDLALQQADTDLASALERHYEPVEFIASTRLGSPPTVDRIKTLLAHNSDLQFKLDPTAEWSPELIKAVADTGRVRILDLKGHYEGTDVDQAPDPALYRRLLEAFPDAIIEDPALTDETEPVFEGHQERVSWDAPIHGVEDIESLPFDPEWLNIKPSRFGSIQSLFETIAYCLDSGISMYGGGQFELDVGRQQLHAIASLWYPTGPNDIAPAAYNDPTLPTQLPRSPLAPPETPDGFRWNSTADQ